MFQIEDYLNAIKTSFVSHNLYFFITAVIIFQIIDLLLSKYFPIKIYQVATFMSLFSFINSPFSAYELMMGGIVASFVSLFIYKLFVFLRKEKKIFLLNIFTFIAVLSSMVLFNCVAMPALAYTLMSYKSIPTTPFNYIYSFIVASIIIIIISFLLIRILTYVNSNILNIPQYNIHFNQIKENISNWSAIPSPSKQ